MSTYCLRLTLFFFSVLFSLRFSFFYYLLLTTTSRLLGQTFTSICTHHYIASVWFYWRKKETPRIHTMAFDHIMTFRCWKMNEFICMPHIWRLFFLSPFGFAFFFFNISFAILCCNIGEFMWCSSSSFPNYSATPLLPNVEVAVFAALSIDFMPSFMVRTNKTPIFVYFFPVSFLYHSIIWLLDFFFLISFFFCFNEYKYVCESTLSFRWCIFCAAL